MFLLILNRPAGLVLPFSTGYLVDDVLIGGNAALLPKLALVIGIATLIQAVTSFALSQILGVAGQRAIVDMRKSVQQHVSRLPTSYFDSTKTGILISRIMTDAEGLRNLVGTGITQMVGGVLTAAIALGCLFYYHWQLTVVVIIVLAVFGAGMAFAFTRIRPIFRKRGEINALVTGRLTESIGGVRVVKAYTAERREALIFAQGAHKLFRNVASSITGVSAIGAFGNVVIGGIGILIIIMGGNAVLDTSMSVGDLIRYIFLTGMVAAPLVQMANIGTQFTEALAGLDRIREIKAMPTEGEGDADREPLGPIDGDIVFENVSFEYDEGVPVLKGISLKARAGTTTALVGSSGSGKSTLIGLIMAFHYPKSGRMLVDGRDLTTIRLNDYRSNIGVVMQDNFLFDGTIADNIRYSRPNATAEEVEAVGRIAHCEEFVNGFENRYETIVGERGVKLSGGQRQRVAIARAIIADPKILILDEATSSLDSESEALIQDGLSTLREGRTTFVIAHRLSTIQSADQILVIEGGEIAEYGTHAELLSNDGRYKELYDKQYKFESNQFVNPGEDFTSKPVTE